MKHFDEFRVNSQLDDIIGVTLEYIIGTLNGFHETDDKYKNAVTIISHELIKLDNGKYVIKLITDKGTYSSKGLRFLPNITRIELTTMSYIVIYTSKSRIILAKDNSYVRNATDKMLNFASKYGSAGKTLADLMADSMDQVNVDSIRNMISK